MSDNGTHSAQYLTFQEMFENTVFHIPDYQRGFSWQDHQVTDLLEDLQNLEKQTKKREDSHHFTGTIVTTKNEGQSDQEFESLNVVDGQQRLTALTLLLKAIHDQKGENVSEEILTRFLVAGNKGNEVFKLNPNKETKQFFHYHILSDDASHEPENDSEEKMKRAKELFDEWCANKDRDLDRYNEIIQKNLKFIFFKTPESPEVGEMFEVINNRGKALSEMEKIKNYFIYYATLLNKQKLRETVNDKWAKMLGHLSKAGVTDNDAENSFIRYCYITFFPSNKDDSWHVYDNLKQHYEVTHEKIEEKVDLDEEIEEIENFTEFIVECARNYAHLHTPEESYGDPRIDRKLNELHCHHSKDSALPLYLAIMARRDQGKLSDDELYTLLETLENLNFRVYVLPKVTHRSDSRQAELFDLAYDFFNENPLNKAVKIQEAEPTAENLRKAMENFILDVCPLRIFVKHLTIDDEEDEDYYNWKGLKYFLAKYEESLKRDEEKKSFDITEILLKRDEGKLNDHLSAEHILAKKSKKEDIPEDHIEKRRLGNLALFELGYNIKQSNKDLEDKIQRLLDDKQIPTELQQANKLVQQFYRAKDFIEKDEGEGGRGRQQRTFKYYEELAARLNDIRETELVTFALQEWGIPAENPERFKEVDSFGRAEYHEKFKLNPYKVEQPYHMPLEEVSE